MYQNFFILIGIIFLSFISGMLGFGIAFSSIPFLGLFYSDLVNQVQPISLFLNGVTATTSFFGFLKSAYVDWKKAIVLAIFTTAFAPIGSIMANKINQFYIWIIYFFSGLYLAIRLFMPVKTEREKENFKIVLILSIPL